MSGSMNDMWKQSLREGIEEGRKEGAIEIAKRMLADGSISLEKIAELAGLALDEVRTLQRDEKIETYTFADLLEWDDGERYELIDGEAVLLASPRRVHQAGRLELSAQLHGYLKGKTCRVCTAPFDVRLFAQEGDDPESIDTVVRPDISVICDPSKLDNLGCKGVPDLIIEILSPSTQRCDRVVKFNLYRKAGVREYWIVDPDGKTAQSFILENGYYIPKEVGLPGEKMPVQIFEDCVMDLVPVFRQ